MEKGKRGYRYDEAFKREAIALVIEKHIPMSTAAKQLGIADQTLRDWIAQSGAASKDASQQTDAQRIRDLERENRMLRQERDILKEAVGIFSQRPK